MRIVGIILVVMGALSLFSTILQTGMVEDEIIASATRGAIMFLGIGAYLMWRDKQKKAEDENKRKWNK